MRSLRFVLIICLVSTVNTGAILWLVGATTVGAGPEIQNGDVNADGSINLADPIYLISYLFESGTPPVALACDEIGVVSVRLEGNVLYPALSDLAWTTATVDTVGAFDPATPNQLTVGPGLWHVAIRASRGAAEIRVNGSPVAAGNDGQSFTTIVPLTETANISAALSFGGFIADSPSRTELVLVRLSD